MKYKFSAVFFIIGISWVTASWGFPSNLPREDLTLSPPLEDNGLGIEVGALCRRNSSGGNFLGMDLAPGGRFFDDLPLWDRYHLRPSVGYFFYTEGEAGVNVWQNNVELGVSLFADLFHEATNHPTRETFYAGLATRMDLTWASTTLPGGYQSSSGIATTFRLGPAISFLIPISLPEVWFSFNPEFTFAVDDGFRPYLGLTVGALYRGF